jgi:lambda family phage portal protein
MAMHRRRRRTPTTEQAKVLELKAAREYLRGFEGAKQSRRTDGWLTQNRGPNADIKPALKWLIQRHQDLVDSDPWIKRAIDVIVSNTIGTGIEGAPLGGTKAFAAGYQDWAASLECDFYGRTNFYGLQELALRTITVRGSVVVRKRLEPSMVSQGLVPLQLQLMEPDWLDDTKDNGYDIIGGKRFDEWGRWVSAFLYDTHPGETGMGRLRLTSTEVPSSELLHVFEQRRPGAYTGVPWGAAVLLRARDIGDYESAEILKQKLAACFAGFVTDADPESTQVGDDLTETIEPGLLQRLAAGQDIKFADPPKVEGYGEFMKQQLRAIAVGYGITYEALTGDLSGSNFSSSRMGWLEFARNISRWQWNMLVPQLLDPVAHWYCEMARMNCSSRTPRRMTWTPPRREMIQPKEEIAYLREAVQAGFMTLSEVQRSFGYVPDDLLDELAADLKGARERGLALSVDGQMDVGRLQAQAFSDQISPPDQEDMPEVDDPLGGDPDANEPDDAEDQSGS